MKIQRGDSVVVISGNSAGPNPRKVIQIVKGGRKVLVEGVNRVLKHVKRGHPKSPQGGRLNLEMPIDSSNIMFYCDSCRKGVKIGFRYTSTGAKERHCRACGVSLGSIGRSKPHRAKG